MLALRRTRVAGHDVSGDIVDCRTAQRKFGHVRVWGEHKTCKAIRIKIRCAIVSLFLMTAVATHLVMSFGQTLLHYKVAHHPIGGRLFRNHINFHHTHYADDHLVSRTYLGDEGNITPYFLIPVFLVGGAAYFLLPLNLFVVMVIVSAASFYAPRPGGVVKNPPLAGWSKSPFRKV